MASETQTYDLRIIYETYALPTALLPLELQCQEACSRLGRQAEAGHRLAEDIASIHHTRAGGNSQELIIRGEILAVSLGHTISSLGMRCLIH